MTAKASSARSTPVVKSSFYSPNPIEQTGIATTSRGRRGCLCVASPAFGCRLGWVHDMWRVAF